MGKFASQTQPSQDIRSTRKNILNNVVTRNNITGNSIFENNIIGENSLTKEGLEESANAKNVQLEESNEVTVNSGEGYYYLSNGTLVAKVGNDKTVRLINDSNADEGKLAAKSAAANFGTKNTEAYQKSLDEAKLYSKDTGIKYPEFSLRVILSVIMSGEGGTGENRYKKKFGGGVLKDLEKHPGLYTWQTYKDKETGKTISRKSSMAGAYQFKGTTYKEISGKLQLTDFYEESQDKAAVYLLQKNNKTASLTGNLQKVVNNLKESTWTSLQKVTDCNAEFKKYAARELANNSLVKTPQGKLVTNETN